MRNTIYYRKANGKEERVYCLDGRVTRHNVDYIDVNNTPDVPDAILAMTEDELKELGFTVEKETE